MEVMTLKARLRDKDRQRFFVTFLGGKMMGIVLAAGIILGPGKFILGTTVHALAPQADVPIQDVVNATNTAWMLVAAFLVFFMQAGFMMLEAGFARTREVVNILHGVHRRHLPVRPAVLGVRLRLHVRHRQRHASATSSSS